MKLLNWGSKYQEAGEGIDTLFKPEGKKYRCCEWKNDVAIAKLYMWKEMMESGLHRGREVTEREIYR